jgi:hypothetical protein
MRFLPLVVIIPIWPGSFLKDLVLSLAIVGIMPGIKYAIVYSLLRMRLPMALVL